MNFGNSKEGEVSKLVEKLSNVVNLWAVQNGFHNINFNEDNVELVSSKLTITITVKENGTTNRIPGTKLHVRKRPTGIHTASGNEEQ